MQRSFVVSASALAAATALVLWSAAASAADGTLVGWGSNTYGQTTVPAGTFKAIAAGSNFSLGLRSDGTLAGWGYNGSGQTTVPAGTFTAIAAGYDHSLGIRSDGRLVGWGDNYDGETTVPAGTFKAIAAGASFSLGIRSDGTLAGWGYNAFGETTVPGGTFTAIAAGVDHSLGIRSDGTLVGWGDNIYGQTTVPAGTFTAIAAGDEFSLGLRSDGSLVGWGDNFYGQTIVPHGKFTAIAAGSKFSLGLRSDGNLAGWGYYYSGQTTVPTGTFTAIAAGGQHSLAIGTLPPPAPGLQWNFNDATYLNKLPPHWTQIDENGSWAVTNSIFGNPSNYVLRAFPQPPVLASGTGSGSASGSGGGAQAEIRLDTYTPPFQITDLSAAVLSFAVTPNSNALSSFTDAFEVTLVDANLVQQALLWQWQFGDPNGEPLLPIHLASSPDADQISENTVYRLRLRFHDNDTKLDSTYAVEVSGLSLTGAVSAVKPGDYNDDGLVDAADYTVWRDTLGRSVTPGSGADGDNNGLIQAADYAVWKANFGVVAGAGSAAITNGIAAVPEPSTITLSALLIVLCASSRAGQRLHFTLRVAIANGRH